MKVAIIHDFLNQFGGAERVLAVIKEIFPDAPVYTSYYEPKNVPDFFHAWDIRIPDISKNFFIKRFYKEFTFLLPLIFENFDLHEYDIVISSTAHFAKGILTNSEQLHICYCHTPPRFLYHYETEYNRRQMFLYKPILMPIDQYFRLWDYASAQRVNYFITNSYITKKRINKFYRRSASVIYPAVTTFMNDTNIEDNQTVRRIIEKPYLLIVSRLAAYKRIDLAIQACNRLKRQLVIIGKGKELKRLKAIAGETIIFLDNISDTYLPLYYKSSDALLFPGEDDFGIVPIEAMSHGKPVIAFGRGGALESIQSGITGEFFYTPAVDDLISVITNFDPKKYKEEACIKQANRFTKEKFKKLFAQFVYEKWEDKNHA